MDMKTIKTIESATEKSISSFAKLVVSNANAKEFAGKNEVKAKAMNLK